MKRKNRKRENPSYRVERIPVLAEDPIIPYGDRIYASSEALRREMALKLLTIPEELNEKTEGQTLSLQKNKRG